MGALIRRAWLGLAVTTIVSSPCAAQSVATWRAFVTEASVRFGVPAVWIERVMQAESGGRTTWQGRPIRSRAGAIGVMQLMPAHRLITLLTQMLRLLLRTERRGR